MAILQLLEMDWKDQILNLKTEGATAVNKAKAKFELTKAKAEKIFTGEQKNTATNVYVKYGMLLQEKEEKLQPLCILENVEFQNALTTIKEKTEFNAVECDTAITKLNVASDHVIAATILLREIYDINKQKAAEKRVMDDAVKKYNDVHDKVKSLE